MKLGKYMKIYENLALVEIVTAHKPEVVSRFRPTASAMVT